MGCTLWDVHDAYRDLPQVGLHAAPFSLHKVIHERHEVLFPTKPETYSTYLSPNLKHIAHIYMYIIGIIINIVKQ